MCESLHNYFIMKSTSNNAVLLNFETKNVETHKFTSTIRTIQLRSGLSMVTMDVFICLDVSVTYNGTTGENQVIMTGICQSLVRIPKRTRQRAKTLNSILIFLFCAEKTHTENVPRKQIYPKTYSLLFTPFLNVIFISFHIHPNTTQLNEQIQTLYIFVNQITQATCLLTRKRRVMFEQTSTFLNPGRVVSTPHIIKGSNCRSNKNP